MIGMRIWPVMILVLATTVAAAPKKKAKPAAKAPAAAAAKTTKAKPVAKGKPAVVLSGPAKLTKFLSKELSKRFTPRTLKSDVGTQPTTAEVRAVTAPASAVALIVVQPAGSSFIIHVLNGADGTPLDAITVKGSEKRVPMYLLPALRNSLMFAINSGVAPDAGDAPAPAPTEEPSKPVAATEPASKPAEPTKTAPPPEKKPVEPVKSPSPVAERPSEPAAPVATVTEPTPELNRPASLPAIKLSVGGGGFNRSLTWSGNPSPYLASGNYPFTANISVDGTWYPAAHFTSNFASNIGVFGAADFGVGMVSKVDVGGDVSRFANSANRMRLGAIVRIPIVDAFTVLAHVGYARHQVTTSPTAINDGSVRPNIPDVLFNGFRGGIGLRARLIGTLEVDAGGAFQAVVGKGEIASAAYFPDATAIAVDAGGGLSVQIVEHIRLRAGVEWQRYFVALHPGENVTYYAQNAADQYITATASLQWSM